MVLGLQREKLLGEVRAICSVGEGFVFVGFGVLLVWFDVLFFFFFFPTLVCKTPSLQPGLRAGGLVSHLEAEQFVEEMEQRGTCQQETSRSLEEG